MAKLTDSQLILLSAAARVGSSLVVRKLMQEVKAKPGMPVWRQGEDGHYICLVTTKAGQKAIGVEGAAASAKARDGKKLKGTKPTAARTPRKQAEQRATDPEPFSMSRAGSKQALVIKMLSGKSGATLDALIEATGWLPHTTRAALTGLRKKGFAIERMREKDASVYRIVGAASDKGARSCRAP